jgi:hypothetical protein
MAAGKKRGKKQRDATKGGRGGQALALVDSCPMGIGMLQGKGIWSSEVWQAAFTEMFNILPKIERHHAQGTHSRRNE